ncbi:methyltransferase [Affinibrenneria salicis]|uniref:Methyltransferase n=1 Tax=Affinibrenneria salicis TaxID=2590031 RepID=A0A5J5FY38_9GAMM|nr:methyltransferase [Affinibrenneria salicis]KAA8999036.1 methyltransferase [Affinibrenneria salicis]
MTDFITSRFRENFSYIRNFVTAPRTVGSLAPSSRWLCRTMLAQVRWQKAFSVAELGAAGGVLTGRILERMESDAHLDAYEIQPDFIRQLSLNHDPRLKVVPRSAEVLEDNYDVIFCCLPLLSLPLRTRMRVLRQAQLRLSKQGGILILFQYTHLMEALLSRYFRWHRVREIRNLPPALVYVCRPK